MRLDHDTVPRLYENGNRDASLNAEHDFRLIVDSIPALVNTMNASGEIEVLNKQVVDYFGKSLEELKQWKQTDTVHPDDRARAIAVWRDRVAAGSTYEVELRLRRFDGVHRWFHIRSVPLRDEKGDIVRWYTVNTDIDDRKRAEDALRRSEKRLRRAIRTRYEAVLAERTRIARDMHDGLLQDLNGIALQLGALLPHVHTSPDSVTATLRAILESIRHIGRTARSTVGQMRHRASTADLVSAVHEEAMRVRSRSALAITLQVSGSVRLVSTDLRDVGVSIVHEAMTNVLKHAQAQSVTIRLTFQPNRLRLAVVDDGCGWTPHADETRRAAHFGVTGMLERAASVGATFRLSSAPGKGTTVRLSAPLAGL